MPGCTPSFPNAHRCNVPCNRHVTAERLGHALKTGFKVVVLTSAECVTGCSCAQSPAAAAVFSGPSPESVLRRRVACARTRAWGVHYLPACTSVGLGRCSPKVVMCFALSEARLGFGSLVARPVAWAASVRRRFPGRETRVWIPSLALSLSHTESALKKRVVVCKPNKCVLGKLPPSLEIHTASPWKPVFCKGCLRMIEVHAVFNYG